jgi:hypothetical protein
MLFENDTVLGFVVEFATVDQLSNGWEQASSRLVERHELALRRSGDKAWNTYCVLLSTETVSSTQRIVLQTIEEDLTGMRKIVRCGVNGPVEITNALLPLLPLQHAPELPTIDLPSEIRARTTELPGEVLQAFLSDAADAIALQVIEEAE